MDELIKKLESAPDGSRELDAEIYSLEKGLHLYGRRDGTCGASDMWLFGDRHIHEDDLPNYTTSIDAALADENIVGMHKSAGGQYVVTHSRNGVTTEGRHRVEAIARRIACLKARSQNNDA